MADLCDTGLPFAAFLFGVFLAIIATYAASGLRSRVMARSLVLVFAAGGALMVTWLADGYGTFLSGWGAPVSVLAGAACLYLSQSMVGDRLVPA